MEASITTASDSKQQRHGIQSPPRMGTRKRRARTRAVRSLAAVLVFLLLWQVCSMTHLLNPLFVSSPLGMVSTLVNLVVSGKLEPDMAASGSEFAIGFGLGIICGVVCGVFIGWSPFLDNISNALIIGFYATPYIMFLPLLVLAAGIGLWSKVIIILWATFFPVLINTIAGVKNTPREFLRVADSFCVGRLRLLTTVILPSAVPYILAGLRQAIGNALVGVIVAEFYIANKGIGFFISSSTSNFQPSDAFAAILLVAIVGVGLRSIVKALEQRYAAYQGL